MACSTADASNAFGRPSGNAGSAETFTPPERRGEDLSGQIRALPQYCGQKHTLAGRTGRGLLAMRACTLDVELFSLAQLPAVLALRDGAAFLFDLV